jgi:polar amino acid transport system substrate-binding protein
MSKFITAGIKIAGFGLVLLVLLFPPALAASTLEDIKAKGEMNIGIANSPPYAWMDKDGKTTGAVYDILRATAIKMGIPQVKVTVVEWGALIPGLQAKRFDAIAAGLYVRDDRCKIILFGEPDVCDREGFIVRKGNPKEITSFAKLAVTPSAKIGFSPGTSTERYCIAARVPKDQMVPVDHYTTGMALLDQGRIDVMAGPMISLRQGLKQFSKEGNYEIAGPFPESPTACSAVGFRMGDEEFRDAYNKAYEAVKKSGEFEKIMRSYNLDPSVTFTTNTATLCAPK